jgi:acyl-CoA thioesterase FadM
MSSFSNKHKPALRIFEQMRDEVTGGWRKLHNEELHNLYSSSSIIRTKNITFHRPVALGHHFKLYSMPSVVLQTEYYTI